MSANATGMREGVFAQRAVSAPTASRLVAVSTIVTTKTYTDTNCLPLFAELEKVSGILPSSIASPKSGNTCQNVGQGGQNDKVGAVEKVTVLSGEAGDLSTADPDRPNVKMAEREGFEPFCRLEAKSLENADLVDG